MCSWTITACRRAASPTASRSVVSNVADSACAPFASAASVNLTSRTAPPGR